MKTSNQVLTVLGVIAALLLAFLWLRWGPDRWEVQITGVTGDGRGVQYRIETVKAGTTDTLTFINEDAGFWPPYFKFDAAGLQSVAGRISRNCPDVPVTVRGYGFRLPFLSMFPNAVSIDAPTRCLEAPQTDTPARRS
ncbi:DUF1523 family protein [Thiohalocapsa sp. ML1]|jgi:hypothetical protein|uniref:DUF1523 family protein n=1 Tax=Thiohalocapsa sp. ML1 TaxID=1431688 RepID=UPI00073229CB|nr:DUF1523 family protein [Thiohalocapsa sp. ML1]